MFGFARQSVRVEASIQDGVISRYQVVLQVRCFFCAQTVRNRAADAAQLVAARPVLPPEGDGLGRFLPDFKGTFDS